MAQKDFDLIIEAGKTEKNYWIDLWRFRELLYILAWRDIKVRYKQTVIGIAWSVIRPLFTMLVFTFVFCRIANLPSEGDAPYAIMVFAALLPWQFFANAVSESSNSLIGNARLITKVYFPRIIIPASGVVTSFIDMAIALLILLLLMLGYGYLPGWRFLLLPLFMLMVFLLAFGVGLLLSAFNVKYRDVRYIIPFILQAGLYISPVGFSSTVVPEKWQLLFGLNPLVGIIDGFRWCILGNEVAFNGVYLIASIIFTALLLIISILYFRRMERKFADVI